MKSNLRGLTSFLFLVVASLLLIAGALFYIFKNDRTNKTPELENKKDKSILVQISAAGGLCPNGICRSEKIILKDGSSGDTNTIKVGKSDLQMLSGLIEETDFDKLRENKFTQTCPTAYDGQEITYTFYTSHGPEVIASCETEIDYNAPLFIKLQEILKR